MIPIVGSMTRPGSPDEGYAELRAGRIAWESGELVIDVATEEFTSNCPTTGQPDFYHVNVRYAPSKFYLESKTLKYYLWSFRDAGFHCETLAKRIAEDIARACECSFVEVTLKQFPRGGLALTAKFTILP